MVCAPRWTDLIHVSGVVNSKHTVAAKRDLQRIQSE
jgi:predicted xylose isomerase-like sugar epimerase